MRAVLLAQGEGWDAAAARTELRQGLLDEAAFVPVDPTDPAAAGVDRYEEIPVLHPYVGFQILGMREYLEDHFESWPRMEARDDVVILVLGGSVAAGFGVMGADRLEARVRADPRIADRRVHVLNLGHCG